MLVLVTISDCAYLKTEIYMRIGGSENNRKGKTFTVLRVCMLILCVQPKKKTIEV